MPQKLKRNLVIQLEDSVKKILQKVDENIKSVYSKKYKIQIRPLKRENIKCERNCVIQKLRKASESLPLLVKRHKKTSLLYKLQEFNNLHKYDISCLRSDSNQEELIPN